MLVKEDYYYNFNFQKSVKKKNQTPNGKGAKIKSKG